MRRLASIAIASLALVPGIARAGEIEVAPGPPSLNEAILMAEPDDVIVLPEGEFVLTQGEALEEKDLTLRGAGAGATTVIPSGGGEAFDDPGVTTEDLTVGPPLQPADETEADEDDGGGISGKAQIIALIATFGIFLFILELVRRRRLAERYAILWMGAGLALLALSIWTGGLDVIANAMGIQEPANAIFLLAFALGFLLLLNFSVASTRLSDETKVLAQEAARLDQELRAQELKDAAPVTPERSGEQP